MIKEFSQNRSNVILNFSVKYCKTPDELLESSGFKIILKKYVKNLKKEDASLLDRLTASVKQEPMEIVFLLRT